MLKRTREEKKKKRFLPKYEGEKIKRKQKK